MPTQAQCGIKGGVSKKNQAAQQRRHQRRAESRQARQRDRNGLRKEQERHRLTRMQALTANPRAALLGDPEQRRVAYELARAERDLDRGNVDVLEVGSDRLRTRVTDRFRGLFDAYLMKSEDALLAYCSCHPERLSRACRHLWASLLTARDQSAPGGMAELPKERLARLPWQFLEQPPPGEWTEPEPPPPRCDVLPPLRARIASRSGNSILRLAPDPGGAGLAVSAGTTYGSSIVPLGALGNPVRDTDGWFVRDAAVELRALQSLQTCGIVLPKGLVRRVERLFAPLPQAETPADLSYAEWLPFARIPAGKAEELVSALLEAGWSVEGEATRYRRGTEAALRLRAQSGRSWLEGEARFGDIGLDACRLLTAIRQRRRFVRLGNGDVGVLAREWLERWELVAAAVPATAGPNGTVELSEARAEAVEVLLDATDTQKTADDTAASLVDLARWGLGIKGKHLAEAEPCSAFVGELRPYQRQGLAWLRSLREQGRGGALCDEMGLGKTVQVLAYLAERNARSEQVLVVAPTSLLGNWSREIARFAPNTSVLLHVGAGRARGVSEFAQATLVLTSYGTLLRDIDLLAKIRFDTVVLDEAQAIKNPRSKTTRATRRLSATNRLALSGTPLENHFGELWSLVEFLNPGMLTWPAYRRIIRRPDPEGRLVGSEILLRLVRPLLLRRTKAEVAPELPPKLEHLVTLELPPDLAAAYADLREHSLRRYELAPADRKGSILLGAVTRLRQLACHPGLLDPRRTGDGSVKIDLLLERLAALSTSGRKALVFSQFTTLLELVRARLQQSGSTFAYLDGATRDRDEQVRRFQEDPAVSVFLVSLKAGGTGLNLTGADDVFLLDPWWNPAVEAQAIDRAHRIGRTRPVIAWRLVVADTIEERVLELQERKRRMAESLFDPSLSTLTEAELLSIL